MTYSESELRDLEANVRNYRGKILPAWSTQSRQVMRLIAQARLANEMGELLQDGEWETEEWGSPYACPYCGEPEKDNRHAPDCKLGNALAKWQE